jgi:hypothetical protein
MQRFTLSYVIHACNTAQVNYSSTPQAKPIQKSTCMRQLSISSIN